jgi:hypothetical protein
MLVLLGAASIPLAAAFAVAAARAPLILVAVYAFVIPFGSGIDLPVPLPAGFDSLTSLAGLLALAGLSLHLVFARQRAIELPSAAPVWLWFLAVSLLTYLWSVNPDTSGDELLALAILIALYLACSLVSVDRRSLAHGHHDRGGGQLVGGQQSGDGSPGDVGPLQAVAVGPDEALSLRALAERHGVHRRTVRAALSRWCRRSSGCRRSVGRRSSAHIAS